MTTEARDHDGEPVDPASVYAQLGGHTVIAELTAAFYRQVAADAAFRAMYPEDDLGPAEERLRLFLIQYFGGPSTYGRRRGHPRLRLRHQPFPIDGAARDTWLRHMRTALDEVMLAPMYDELVWDYFTRAAQAMVNTLDPHPAREPGARPPLSGLSIRQLAPDERRPAQQPDGDRSRGQ